MVKKDERYTTKILAVQHSMCKWIAGFAVIVKRF